MDNNRDIKTLASLTVVLPAVLLFINYVAGSPLNSGISSMFFISLIILFAGELILVSSIAFLYFSRNKSNEKKVSGFWLAISGAVFLFFVYWFRDIIAIFLPMGFFSATHKLKFYGQLIPVVAGFAGVLFYIIYRMKNKGD